MLLYLSLSRAAPESMSRVLINASDAWTAPGDDAVAIKLARCSAVLVGIAVAWSGRPESASVDDEIILIDTHAIAS